MADRKSAKVLMSFGARMGGFEFALQLRKDIMQKYSVTESDNSHFVYLDAISLEGDKQTHYEWNPNLGIWKMSNLNWEVFYQEAMKECQAMIFLLSKPWLESKWCWKELDWYTKKIKTQKDKTKVKTIFVVFNDARDILDEKKTVNASGDTRKAIEIVKTMWNTGGTVIHIDEKKSDAPQKVTVEGETFEYEYAYACSARDVQNIIQQIGKLS